MPLGVTTPGAGMREVPPPEISPVEAGAERAVHAVGTLPAERAVPAEGVVRAERAVPAERTMAAGGTIPAESAAESAAMGGMGMAPNAAENARPAGGGLLAAIKEQVSGGPARAGGVMGDRMRGAPPAGEGEGPYVDAGGVNKYGERRSEDEDVFADASSEVRVRMQEV